MGGDEGTVSSLADRELSALVDAFPDVGFVLDADGTYHEVISGPESEELLYDDPEGLLGSRIEDVFDPEWAERLLSAIDESLSTGSLQRVEYPLEVPAGTRWFEARIHPVEPESGDPDRVVFVARDVTERRRYERKIERQRGYMQALLESTDDLFLVADFEGTLVDWNQQVVEVTGYREEDLESIRARNLFSEANWDAVEAVKSEVAETGRAKGELDVVTADGESIPYEFVVTLFEDGDGDDLLAAIGREVTERKRREAQLQQQKDLLDGVLRSIDDVFCLLDGEGELVRYNRRVPEVTGYDEADVESMSPTDFFAEDDRAAVADAIHRGFEEGRAQVRADCVTADGESIPYEFVVNAFDRRDGERMLACLGRDVSERAERKRQVRVFGRVLRHDIRNKMGIVRGATERVEADLEDTHPELDRVQQAVYDLLTTSEKAHDLTDFLLTTHSVRVLDVAEAVEAAAETCRNRYPGADVDVDVPAEDVLAIPAVERAFVEVIENAVVHGESTVSVSADVTADAVVVRVADEGPGIPETETGIIEGRTEITPITHGSGLGLWLVNWIVDRSGGQLRFRDADPRGTVVCVELRRP